MAEPDLNLLRVFDTLMEHRSVTRAAERMNLTQSAVSHALGRLRAMLGDPLFVRGTAGLRPTRRAEEIAPGIRDGLARLRGALDQPEFLPGEATRRFTIAAGSYFCDLLVPRLVERLRDEAPGVSLRVVPVTDTADRALDNGAVDIVLGGAVKPAPRFVEETLFEEEMVWIAAADNPLAREPFDTASLTCMSQVAISVPRPLDFALATGSFLAQIFPTLVIDGVRETADPTITVYDSQTAMAIVARTRSVAMVPRRQADAGVLAGRIAILSAGGITAPLSMLWHHKQDADAGLAWFRRAIRACFG